MLLSAVAKHYPLSLFTPDTSAVIPNVHHLGTVDYDSEMPYVFANSKINLNITLRSIKSGIPLQCMDILGSGGYLLTNYQSDFQKHFEPETDFVYFEDKSDLIHKIYYYLSHDEKRKEITENGYQKVKEYHSFKRNFLHIFKIIDDCNRR